MAINKRRLYSDSPSLDELYAVLERGGLSHREWLQVQLEIDGYNARIEREERWKERKRQMSYEDYRLDDYRDNTDNLKHAA